MKIGSLLCIFVASLLLLASVSAGCNSGPAEINAETTYVDLNAEFVIVLESHKNAGYEWSAEYDETILLLVKTEYKPYDTYTPGGAIIVGGGGQEIFHFSAVKKAKTIITFINKRSWESEIAQTIRYEVNIK